MRHVLMTLALAVTAVGAWAKEDLPEVDSNGLHLVEHSELRVVYARPGVDLKQFDKVILVQAYVAFQKNWMRDQNQMDPLSVSPQDAKKIKERVGEEFHKAFTQELAKKGIPVVPDTDLAADVLIVRPAIINLNVEAPETMGTMGDQTYSGSAGSMTLFAELYDAVSSQLIAKVIDPEADQGFGGSFMAQNSVTNLAAEQRIVDRWANILAKHMSALTTK